MVSIQMGSFRSSMPVMADQNERRKRGGICKVKYPAPASSSAILPKTKESSLIIVHDRHDSHPHELMVTLTARESAKASESFCSEDMVPFPWSPNRLHWSILSSRRAGSKSIGRPKPRPVTVICQFPGEFQASFQEDSWR